MSYNLTKVFVTGSISLSVKNSGIPLALSSIEISSLRFFSPLINFLEEGSLVTISPRQFLRPTTGVGGILSVELLTK